MLEGKFKLTLQRLYPFNTKSIIPTIKLHAHGLNLEGVSSREYRATPAETIKHTIPRINTTA